MIRAMLPPLEGYRQMSKGILAEGYRAWEAGDHDLLPATGLVLLRSAHHLNDNCSTLIQRLVGTAVAALGYRALRNALALCDDPDSLAAKILPELEAADPSFQPFAAVYSLERLMSWDMCQRVFIPGPQSGQWRVEDQFLGPLVAADNDPGAASRLSRQLAAIGYEKTLREFNQYYDAFDGWTDTPYHLATDRAQQLEKLAGDNKNPLVRIMTPSLTRVRLLDEMITTERRATHLLVHLFAHRAKHGKFPRSLGKLAAPDLDELRLDPFSGQDLVYKKRRWNFKLYSVSGNLQDDGGKHDPKWEREDRVFWPSPE